MLFFSSSKKDDAITKKDYLIIHGAHHKAGTFWFNRILKKISDKFFWNYEEGTEGKRYPDDNVNIFFHSHSDFDFSKISNYRGTHVIRDPRDMIISGYFYHLWCKETWCNIPIDEFNGKSYQEIIKNLEQDDAIHFEMSNKFSIFRKQAQLMSNWNYDDTGILELKFEDLITNPDLFNTIFDYYGFNKTEKNIALSIASRITFEKLTGRKPGNEVKNHHFRKGIVGDWKNYFTSSHKTWFKNNYQELLEKLGYENNRNW